MEGQNSTLISEESPKSFVLTSSLATGTGEANLRSNSNITQWIIPKQSPAPMSTSPSHIQPQLYSKQPTQLWDTNRITPLNNKIDKQE